MTIEERLKPKIKEDFIKLVGSGRYSSEEALELLEEAYLSKINQILDEVYHENM